MSQLCLLALTLFSLWDISSGVNVTRINRNSDILLLKRQKRYLTFPTGSNLVLTMSFVKAVMQIQPKGYNVIGECDVPFLLPNDTRTFVKQYKLHERQKREMYSVFEESLNRFGLNGTACLNGFICDAQKYVLATKQSNSLVGDLLSALFAFPEDTKSCSINIREYCKISLFDYVMNSLRN